VFEVELGQYRFFKSVSVFVGFLKVGIGFGIDGVIE